MNEVSLMEMMNARELRAACQQRLLNRYSGALICLTLNIPGPVKVLPGVPEAFDTACRRIEEQLRLRHLPVSHKETVREKTGYEAFYCVEAKPELIKACMLSIEDQDRLGRLFDIDVLRRDGSKVSRENLGFPARSCLLCGEPAHVCSRSRRHSVKELVQEITAILEKQGAQP